jgi:DNA polymerase-3 subunit gamma/tau
MLGKITRERMYDLMNAVAGGDAETILREVAELAEHITDFSGVLVEIISMLHQIALLHAVPGAIDHTHPYARLAEALSQKLSPQDVQLYYQIALIGRRDLPLAVDSRAGLEMVLLRMLSFKPLSQTQSPKAGSAATATDTVAEPCSPALAAKPSSDATAPAIMERTPGRKLPRTRKIGRS